jgi:parallel beta helix pectate lyase-like protein
MSSKTYKMGRLAVLLVLCVGLASVGMAANIYVDAASAGPFDGQTPATAFLTIQEGVDLAANPSSNAGADVVNVAAGVYVAGAIISDSDDVTVLGAGTPTVTGPGFFGLANFIARNQAGANVVTIDGFACSGAAYGIASYPVDGAGTPVPSVINLNVNNCIVTAAGADGIVAFSPGAVNLTGCAVIGAVGSGINVADIGLGVADPVVMSNVSATGALIGCYLGNAGATNTLSDVAFDGNVNYGMHTAGLGTVTNVGGTVNTFNGNGISGVLIADSAPAGQTVVIANAEVTGNGMVLPGPNPAPDLTRGAGAIAIANGSDGSNVTLNTVNVHDNGFGNVVVFGLNQVVALNNCTLDSPGLNPAKGGNWYFACNLATENWNNSLTMTGGTMAVTTPGSWMNMGVGSNANGPNTITLDGVDASAVNEGALLIGDTANVVLQNGTVLNDGAGTGIWLHPAASNGTVTITDSTMDGLIVEHGPNNTLNMTNVQYTGGGRVHVDGPNYTVNLTNVNITSAWDGISVYPNGVGVNMTVTGCDIPAGSSAMFTQAIDGVYVFDSTNMVGDGGHGLLIWGGPGADNNDVTVRNGCNIETLNGGATLILQGPGGGTFLAEDSTFLNRGWHNATISGPYDATYRRCLLDVRLNAGIIYEGAGNGTLVVEDTTITNPPWGSIVFWVGTTVDATITGCRLQGGGFGIEDSSVSSVVNVTDTDIVNAWHGIWTGRVANDGNAVHTYTGCHWWHDATLAGGMAWPILARESNIDVTTIDCEFGPTNTNAAGGHLWDASGAAGSRYTITGCELHESFGGGIHFAGGANNTLTVSDTTIRDGGHGWAVHADQANLVSSFTDCLLQDGPPGGNVIQLFGPGHRATIERSIIEKRVNATHAIWMGTLDNELTMTNSVMIGGTYQIVWVANASTGLIANNTFIGVEQGGGLPAVTVWFRDGTPSAPVIYRNNVAYGNGNAAYDCYTTGGGTSDKQDNVVHPASSLVDVGFAFPTGAAMVAYPGDLGLVDVHLQAGSPLINAGSYMAATGILDFDQGDDRVAGFAVDIGADEFAPHLLSIVRDDPQAAVDSRSLSYTVTFDQPVSGVDGSDFDLGGTPVLYVPNAPAAALGSIYRMADPSAAFTVTDNGAGVFTVVVNVMAGAGSVSLDLVDDNTIEVQSTPLNGDDLGTRYVGEVYDVTDTLNPNLLSIELINGSPTSRDTVDFRFTFDELMEGPSLTPGSSGVGGVNTHVVDQDVFDGKIANIAATLADPNLDGSVNAWINSGLDMVGLPLAANFSSAAYVIDNAVPIIWDIVRTGGALREQNDVAFVLWTVQFDMLVTGVDAADFVLVGTYLDQTTAALNTVITGTAAGVGPFDIDVTVSTGYPTPVISNSGTLRLDTVVAPTIFDAATGTHQLGGPFAGGEDYLINNVPRPPATVPGPWMLY